MDTKLIATGIVALIVGMVGGYALGGGEGALDPHAHHEESGMHESMEHMMANLDGKTGDEFDRAFLEEMVVHHEGAIAMAEAALAYAEHEELKQLAASIIESQTGEIAQMRAWFTSWYGQ